MKVKALPKGMSLVLINNGHAAQLYQTEIVKIVDGSITLRCGGWYTMHTKKCINLTFSKLGLAFNVFQKKGAWFVSKPDGAIVPFVDGMQF